MASDRFQRRLEARLGERRATQSLEFFDVTTVGQVGDRWESDRQFACYAMVLTGSITALARVMGKSGRPTREDGGCVSRA